MAKPKVAFYWCSSCGGCEETIVDLAENILPVVEAVDIVLWPVALDTKLADVKGWAANEIDVCFINGAIRLSEQEEWVKLLREKSKLVIAFGACAHIGGIPGLANLTTRDAIIEQKYMECPTIDNPNSTVPLEKCHVTGLDLDLPRFWDEVDLLDQVIEVDYYLPGCPPPTRLVAEALNAILSGTLPDKGAVLAPVKSLCETCPLNESKPEKVTIETFRRIATAIPDPEECFLAQGFICLGPATRGGCGERCIRGNMPCRGCFGPTPGTVDVGAKMIGTMGSLGTADTESAAQALADSAQDLPGTLYRFSVPASLLQGSATHGAASDD